ncbi:O-antigen ligase family protein [Clostridium chrysemydis]|uniref:O-antigen ligase family protein n=1 Tax=Clostridium chrysemydis TaxID=2665504 RepID=UPI003F3F7AB3
MLEKLKKLNYEELSVYLLILFAFGLIGSKSISVDGIEIYVQIVAIFSVVFIIFEIYNIVKQNLNFKEFVRNNKYIIAIISAWVIFSLIRMGYSGFGSFIYQLNKVIPYVTFIFFLFHLRRKKKQVVQKYFNFITYIFIVSFILALGMYCLGYTNGAFSLDTILNLVSFDESRSLFGEVRLYWLLSHKARFAVYCYIGLLFIVRNNNLNNRVKVIGIVSSFICIILSNSMMGIVIYLFVGFMLIIDKFKIITKVKNSKKAKIVLVVLAIISIVVGVIVLVIISKKRNIWTLGSRTFIWSAGLDVIKNNINGIGVMPNEFWIEAFYNNKIFYFTNGHNNYLNEIIEVGIPVGLLYIGSIIGLIIKFFKRHDWIFFITLIVTLLGFCNFESLNINELPYIILFSYAIFYYNVFDKSCKESLNE